ncbi:MAG: pseudouridine synthase [Bacteroidales bacterium]
MRTNENSSRTPRSNNGDRRPRTSSNDRPRRERGSDRNENHSYREGGNDRNSNRSYREGGNTHSYTDRNSDRKFSPRGDSHEKSNETRAPRSFDKNDRPIYGDRENTDRSSYQSREERTERRYTDRSERTERPDRAFSNRSERSDRGERSYGGNRAESRSSESNSYTRNDQELNGEKPSRRTSERPSYPRNEEQKTKSDRSSYSRRDNTSGNYKSYRENADRPSYQGREDRTERKYTDRPDRAERSERTFTNRGERSDRGESRYGDNRGERNYGERSERRSSERSSDRPFRERTSAYRDTPSYTDRSRSMRKNDGTNPDKHKENATQREDGFVRLNKYISNAGICSRREADTLISSGAIKVNGEICTILGTMVGPADKVQFGDQSLTKEKKVYLLMNKPKDYITTSDDPQERKTVLQLIAGACKERIYPVGRLDRNTTGVLLFTNDGEVAKKLTHPSQGARKIYHVTLDKAITKTDLSQIADGLQLEDGFIEVDEVSLLSPDSKKEVGIQIHSGRNRIVRRIFEHLGYTVTKLDRVLFAELSKKELSRGQWRMLTEKEISFLRMNV